jgi:hypothetical protein
MGLSYEREKFQSRASKVKNLLKFSSMMQRLLRLVLLSSIQIDVCAFSSISGSISIYRRPSSVFRRPIFAPMLFVGMNSFMEERLTSIQRTFNELTERLADPDITSNPKAMREASQERSKLEEVVSAYAKWTEMQQHRREAQVQLQRSALIPKFRVLSHLLDFNLGRICLMMPMTKKCAIFHELK